MIFVDTCEVRNTSVSLLTIHNRHKGRRPCPKSCMSYPPGVRMTYTVSHLILTYIKTLHVFSPGVYRAKKVKIIVKEKKKKIEKRLEVDLCSEFV